MAGATSFDLSQIRTNQLDSGESFRELAGIDNRDSATAGLFFTGEQGSALVCSYDAAMNTVDFMLRVRVRVTAVRGVQTQVLIERWNVASNVVYQFMLGGSGQPILLWSVNGTAVAATVQSSASLPHVDGELLDIAVTFDSDSGSGQYAIKFWYGTPSHELDSWSVMQQLGNTLTGAAQVMFAGTSNFRLGNFGLATAGAFMGSIFRAEQWSGIDPQGSGNCILSARLHGYESPWRYNSPALIDSQGKSWSIVGTNWSFKNAIQKIKSIPLFCYEGDSLTGGVGHNSLGFAWWAIAERQRVERNRTIFRAVAGKQITAAIASNANDADPFLDTENSYIFGWFGTNDLRAGATTATVIARLQEWADARTVAGWKVVLFTILPRSEAGVPVDFEANRQIVNQWIRDNWEEHAVLLVDVAANALIGDAGDEENLTYYSNDKVHMNAAGYAVVAGIVNAQLATIGIK